jgi:hypothetical protein
VQSYQRIYNQKSENNMNITLPLVIIIFALAGCSSTPILEGEVISSKSIGQGATEHLVKAKNVNIPYFKIRSNKHKFQKGSKVIVELP